MKITQVIEILKTIQAEKGDLEVLVAHPTSDPNELTQPWIRSDYDENEYCAVIIE